MCLSLRCRAPSHPSLSPSEHLSPPCPFRRGTPSSEKNNCQGYWRVEWGAGGGLGWEYHGWPRGAPGPSTGWWASVVRVGFPLSSPALSSPLPPERLHFCLLLCGLAPTEGSLLPLHGPYQLVHCPFCRPPLDQVLGNPRGGAIKIAPHQGVPRPRGRAGFLQPLLAPSHASDRGGGP